MGRYPSPTVKHDLSRLEDAVGRDAALNSLKCCVEQLGPDSISYFLHQIAVAHQHVPRPYVISLYEDVARVHRSLLVPYIPSVLEALVCALSESGSSHRVQEACAKVVVGISIYCIDFGSQAGDVLRMLCEPMLDTLVSNFEPLSEGSAYCIKALVQSRNWVHASLELQDQVASGVTIALKGKSGRTLAHLQLACVLLSKGDPGIMRSYGLHLLNVGKDVLQAVSSSWNLRVGAAQLLNAVMRVMDGFGFKAEILAVTEVLDKYRLDSMRKVRLAVAEALRTARKCCAHGGGVTGTDMLLAVGAAVTKKPVRSWKSLRASKLFQLDRERVQSSKSRPEVISFDLVVSELEKSRPGTQVAGVKTEVGKPCGDLIQEWIKVHNGYPCLGNLDGIDQELEYEELEEALNQQYMSMKNIVEAVQESETAEVPKTEAGLDEQNEVAAEWSVINNPIATKNEPEVNDDACNDTSSSSSIQNNSTQTDAVRSSKDDENLEADRTVLRLAAFFPDRMDPGTDDESTETDETVWTEDEETNECEILKNQETSMVLQHFEHTEQTHQDHVEEQAEEHDEVLEHVEEQVQEQVQEQLEVQEQQVDVGTVELHNLEPEPQQQSEDKLLQHVDLDNVLKEDYLQQLRKCDIDSEQQQVKAQEGDLEKQGHEHQKNVSSEFEDRGGLSPRPSLDQVLRIVVVEQVMDETGVQQQDAVVKGDGDNDPETNQAAPERQESENEWFVAESDLHENEQYQGERLQEDLEAEDELEEDWSCIKIVEKGWHGLQCGVEIVLGTSACVLVGVPALMAVFKSLERTSSDCYYYHGSFVPT